MKLLKSISLMCLMVGTSAFFTSHAEGTSTAGVPVPVKIGGGSYASCPPAYKSRTNDRGGSWASYIETMNLYADELSSSGSARPIPSNDWWTNLMVSRFADALWSYPQMVKPSAAGVTVNYPSYWSDNGTEVKSRSNVRVSGADFTADCARATDWHDWDVVMTLPGTDGGKIKTTMAHGIPFTWFEMEKVVPMVSFSAIPEFYDASGKVLSVSDLYAKTYDYLAIKIGDDVYGLFFPTASYLDLNDGVLTIFKGKERDLNSEPGNSYVVVGLMKSVTDLNAMARYAYSVPRSTKVDWKYDANKSLLTTEWKVNAQSLRGDSQAPVLQGFLPHVYKHASSTEFEYTGTEYLTPRGKLRMGVQSGNSFVYSRRFSGMLPHYAPPAANVASDPNYRSSRLDSLITSYADRGTFGADTYWGGKGLEQMALNMTFALETGNQVVFETSRKKLRATLENWLTYTPGEDKYFFAYYPRWGSLVGYDYSYDSDRFNDHHFHYGYFIYAGALLCLNDPDFREQYGPMLRELAKDYANWDRNDTRYPFLRTIDPWVGHSYAGGLGDGLNDNGNGQESSSESMQAWGGIYMLGVALGDDAMRDAGIFGWLTESAATGEYWFDRDHIKSPEQGNYDYTRYTHPYNTNITCKGIGWWTWFSGDPLWMHSIQWMPVSPCLNYLSHDLEFARWDYETMLRGTSYSWFKDEASTESPLADQSVGNVVLCYLERSNPTLAASIFDKAYDLNYGMARNIDTGHKSYFVIHSHLRWGDIDFSVCADIPTAQAYRKANGEYTYMAYNPTGAERDVTFRHADGTVRKFRLPVSKRIVCFSSEPEFASLAIDVPGYIEPGGNAPVAARLLDNYGAEMGNGNVVITVAEGDATFSNGVLTVSANAVRGSEVKLVANYEGVSTEKTIVVNAAPVVAEASISPKVEYLEVGGSIAFTATASDQYGNQWNGEPQWSITSPAGEVEKVSNFTATSPGRYTVSADFGGKQVAQSFVVTPKLPNLALNKPVKVSSYENAGTVAANATDGKTDTRWGSKHTDNEWIMVDLGADCRILGTEIIWETARARDYRIEVATEAAPDDWQVALEVTGLENSGSDPRQMQALVRYVRMQGVSRSTIYGYSMFEFRVMGIGKDTDLDAVSGVEIKVPALVAENDVVSIEAYGWNLRGEKTPVNPQWSLSNPDAEVKDGYLSTSTPGELILTAKVGDVESSATVLVCETVHFDHAEFSAAESSAVQDVELPLTVNSFNQFGGMWPNGAFDSVVSRVAEDGSLAKVGADEATYDSERGIFIAHQPGKYVVAALGATGVVNVVALADANIALGKPTTASSVYGGNVATNATDGKLTTRWESAWQDGQTLTVDLRKVYNLSRVKIYWEGAYAKAYDILVSTDNRNWTEVYSTVDGKGKTETISLPTNEARYLRVQCNRRALNYGNSIYEIEAYATPNASSVIMDNLVGAEQDGELFDLQGRRCDSKNPAAGIYLRRHKGKIIKVIIP